MLSSVARRVVTAPLWLHAAALAFVLVAVMPIVGTRGFFSADEGVAVAQAHLLSEGEGWTTSHPFPAADPSGDAFPLELVQRRGDAYAPFVKHPLYAVLLAGADKVGGRNAMVLLSVIGTWCAAAIGALIARRLDARNGVAIATLWLIGVASPLFFDSYVLIAHTLGAASAALAGLAVVRLIEASRSRVAYAAVLAVAMFVCVLLRTEAQLLAIGLAVGLLVVARRSRDWSIAMVALVPLVAGGAARVLEGRWVTRIMGGPPTDVAQLGNVSRGGFADQVRGFVITYVLPAYRPSIGALLTVFLGTMIVFAGVVIIREPDDRKGPFVFLGGAIAIGLARATLGSDPIPGLLIAFPALVLVVVAAPWRPLWRDERVTALVVSSSTFALLVLATQFSTGGSGEWGGRYFAIGLPLIVPVVTLGLASLLDRVSAADRRKVALLFGVALALFGVLAVRALRQAHEDGNAVVAGITTTANDTPPGDGGRPVVVSTNGAIVRYAVDELDDGRWLTMKFENMGPYTDRFRQLGVDAFTFVTTDRDTVDRVPGYRPTSVTEPVGGWFVARMQQR